MNLKLVVNGPDILLKEVISHPRRLIAIPPQQIMWPYTQFKFRQQMKDFPEFKFSVTLSYNQVKLQTIVLPDMNLATFVNSLDATTQEFSGFWKQGGSDQVHSLPRTPGISMDDLSRALNRDLHTKTVQRISREEIFIGSLVSMPFKILVHLTFGGQEINIKVMTNAAPLTASVLDLLKKILS
jgi:AP-4 complex subunit epsilon-1